MISSIKFQPSKWSVAAAIVAAAFTSPANAQVPASPSDAAVETAQTTGIALNLCDSASNASPVTLALTDQSVTTDPKADASPAVSASFVDPIGSRFSNPVSARFSDPVSARMSDAAEPVAATISDNPAGIAAPISSSQIVGSNHFQIRQTAAETTDEAEIAGETVGELAEVDAKQVAIAMLTKSPAKPQQTVKPKTFQPSHQTQTRRRIQLPLKSPKKAQATLPVMQRLADPERFRVSRTASSRRTFPYQDDAAVEGTLNTDGDSAADQNGPQELPSLSAIRRKGADRSRDRDDDVSLLESLPDTSLYDGIGGAPLAEAVYNRQVADPNLTFLANAMPGADYRDRLIPTTKTWRTPDMVHRPLYFEQPNLERHGISKDRWQPIVSGAHFFTSVVFLPYKVGSQPFSECVYPIGEARPGDCVTPYRAPVEFNRRGFLFQATRAGIVFGGL